MRRQEIKKKYYNKYVPNHNHLNDKFISLSQVNYLINVDKPKLTTRTIILFNADYRLRDKPVIKLKLLKFNLSK